MAKAVLGITIVFKSLEVNSQSVYTWYDAKFIMDMDVNLKVKRISSIDVETDIVRWSLDFAARAELLVVRSG